MKSIAVSTRSYTGQYTLFVRRFHILTDPSAAKFRTATVRSLHHHHHPPVTPIRPNDSSASHYLQNCANVIRVDQLYHRQKMKYNKHHSEQMFTDKKK